MAADASRSGEPALSVVLACTHPWPALAPCLDALSAQAEAADAEILVGDSHAAGFPAAAQEGHPRACRLALPGASPYALRAAGLRAARAPIVAVTEDHCIPAPDWCKGVLEAHARWPEAAVIGGAVENGATRTWAERASFYVANGSFLPPIPGGPRPFVSGQANVSYKRDALPPDLGPHGSVEAEIQRSLARAGAQLVSVPDLLVTHVQPLSGRESLAINFHNGRTQMGFNRPTLTGKKRVRRFLWSLAIPLRVPWDTARLAARIHVRKGRPLREVLPALPWAAAILAAHACGEIVGLMAGPGGSPRRMQ